MSYSGRKMVCAGVFVCDGHRCRHGIAWPGEKNNDDPNDLIVDRDKDLEA